jgi:hypothetical protein
MSHQSAGFARCIGPARPRERGLKPERGAGSAGRGCAQRGRLDEPEQVDMVLGDGTRDRGALADQISNDPATGAGIAYVRLEAHPDPVRVRAAWVSDTDITAMCEEAASPAPLDLAATGAAA